MAGASCSTSRTWRASGRTHDRLPDLVDALLAERLGPYRNPLDERAAELTDPADVPGAAHLAERLPETRDRAGTVWIEPDRGVDLALLADARAVVGDRVRRLGPGDRPAPGDLVLPAGSVRPLLLFKALQLLQCRGLADPLQDYVAFDLETTEMDPAECDIVELAAVRVRGRVIVEQFQRLVRPVRPISAAARPPSTATTTRTSATSPLLAEVWPAFREFVGDDLLVAHNGHTFDVPVLRRLAAGLPGIDELVFFDTLPLARSLIDESARLEDLGAPVRRIRAAARTTRSTTPARWSASPGTWASSGWRARGRRPWSSCSDGSGLALALDDAGDPTPEERLLRDLATPAALGRYSGCLEAYAEQVDGHRTRRPAEELIERLGGQPAAGAPPERSPRLRALSRLGARLQALVETSAAPTLAESLELLLGRVALSRSDGFGDRRPPREPADPARDQGARVLPGLHRRRRGQSAARAAIALEDDNQHDIQEARRLLYVGMTRAKDRLVLTRALQRDGRADRRRPVPARGGAATPPC